MLKFIEVGDMNIRFFSGSIFVGKFIQSRNTATKWQTKDAATLVERTAFKNGASQSTASVAGVLPSFSQYRAQMTDEIEWHINNQ